MEDTTESVDEEILDPATLAQQKKLRATLDERLSLFGEADQRLLSLLALDEQEEHKILLEAIYLADKKAFERGKSVRRLRAASIKTLCGGIPEEDLWDAKFNEARDTLLADLDTLHYDELLSRERSRWTAEMNSSGREETTKDVSLEAFSIITSLASIPLDEKRFDTHSHLVSDLLKTRFTFGPYDRTKVLSQGRETHSGEDDLDAYVRRRSTSLSNRTYSLFSHVDSFRLEDRDRNRVLLTYYRKHVADPNGWVPDDQVELAIDTIWKKQSFEYADAVAGSIDASSAVVSALHEYVATFGPLLRSSDDESENDGIGMPVGNTVQDGGRTP